MKKMERRLKLEFNSKEKSFISDASLMYASRPTYYNPLMGMAAIPACRMSK
jgi:hypothetical protein